jgi:hypothetical protein
VAARAGRIKWSREMTRRVEVSPGFNVVAELREVRAARRCIDDTRLDVLAILTPWQVTDRPPAKTLPWVADGSDANSRGVSLSYCRRCSTFDMPRD